MAINETVFVETPALWATSARETFLGLGGRVDMGLRRFRDERAALSGIKMPKGFKLGDKRTEGRGLDRATDHRHARNTRGQIAQETVAGASTNEIELFGAPSRYLGEFVNGSGVASREGLNNEAHIFGHRRGAGGSLLLKRGVDLLAHFPRLGKTRIIRIEECRAGRALSSLGDEFIRIGGSPFTLPLTYLRQVQGDRVYAVDWPEKMKAFPYIDILKVNEFEMDVLTGHSDPIDDRPEERRVGKECRSRWSPYH